MPDAIEHRRCDAIEGWKARRHNPLALPLSTYSHNLPKQNGPHMGAVIICGRNPVIL